MIGTAIVNILDMLDCGKDDILKIICDEFECPLNKDVEKFLKYKGFECNRQGNTTHAVWKNPTTGKSVPVPNKSGTMCQGTTSKVLKQIGSNRQELADFLYA